ncbi:MAG: glycosyltransferase [Gammaproteobacteria bacterium]|nr:glycosyltransferase [Gammaproteobacteria bacterium]
MAFVPGNGRSRTRILVFSKAPVPGRVKTRLIPALGSENAARLYEQFVRGALSTALASGVGETELWCTPSTAHRFFREMEAGLGVKLCLQQGVDLGQRMSFAFDSVLTGAGEMNAILMGSDCPDLSSTDLINTVQALQDGCDAVLGPAEDGGYVLLGLRSPAPDLFLDMPWGTETVLETTRERLRRLGFRWHELPVYHDVDRPEDLDRLG